MRTASRDSSMSVGPIKTQKEIAEAAGVTEVTGNTYNDDQKAAVSYGKGPLWVTAGPGSGKTEVLVARTLKLIVCDGIKPESIILTTFTERAARSLLNRVSSYIDDLGMGGSVDATSLKTGTLHSICNSVMRDFRYPAYVDLELLDENSRPSRAACCRYVGCSADRCSLVSASASHSWVL